MHIESFLMLKIINLTKQCLKHKKYKFKQFRSKQQIKNIPRIIFDIYFDFNCNIVQPLKSSSNLMSNQYQTTTVHPMIIRHNIMHSFLRLKRNVCWWRDLGINSATI